MVEIVCDACRVQTQESRALGERPSTFVAIVIPAPLKSQVVVAEVVVRGQCFCCCCAVADARLSVNFALVVIDLYRRPSILPTNGQQIGHAAVRSFVGKKHRPPFAALCLDERSLMDVSVVEQELLFVGAENILRAEHSLVGGESAVCGVYIIVVANLVQAAALEAALYAVFCNLFILYSLEILVYFGDTYVVYSVSNVCIVAIEKKAAIIESALQLLLFPWPFNVVAREQKASVIEGVEKYVEFAFIVLQRRGPLSAAVSVLAIFEVVGLAVLDCFERIAAILPIYKVFRL